MISTIRTWVHRIKDYEYQKKVKMNSMEHLRDQINNLHSATIQYETGWAITHENLKKKEKEYTELQNEMKRLVSLLSGDTWKEGDNMMESIEAYQQDKYLKEHAEDFLMIMTQNAPEVAAQEIFEYFELEVPDSTNIEIETAKKLYDLWCNAQNSLRFLSSEAEQECIEWSKLRDVQKEFFIQEVYKLWNK